MYDIHGWELLKSWCASPQRYHLSERRVLLSDEEKVCRIWAFCGVYDRNRYILLLLYSFSMIVRNREHNVSAAESVDSTTWPFDPSRVGSKISWLNRGSSTPKVARDQYYIAMVVECSWLSTVLDLIIIVMLFLSCVFRMFSQIQGYGFPYKAKQYPAPDSEPLLDVHYPASGVCLPHPDGVHQLC